MLQLPHELSLAIKGLDSEHRQRILLSLIEKEKLSFSEISNRANINRSLLANHLKILSKTLLIEHYYEHEIGNERYSYYRISPFGKALLGNMLGTLIFQQAEITLKLELSMKTTNAYFSPFDQLKAKEKTEMTDASSGETNLQTIRVTKRE